MGKSPYIPLFKRGTEGDLDLTRSVPEKPNARRCAVPTVKLDETLEMYYEDDDFTDPWRTPETVVLHHGNTKSSRLWYGWVQERTPFGQIPLYPPF